MHDSPILKNEDVEVRSLEALRTPRALRSPAVIAILLLGAAIAGLVLIPWQQSVTGTGRVIVMSPEFRPQNIESLIPARIVKWNVQEGDLVQADQPLVELSDIDSKFLDASQVERMRQQRRAQQAKLTAANSRARAIETQIENVTRSREIAMPSAAAKARQNIDKQRAVEQTVQAAKQNVTTTELNRRRIQDLADQGLRSQRDLEVAQLDNVRAKTELERAQASLAVSQTDLSIGDFDTQKVEVDTAAGISSLNASLASVRETIATIESDILKLDVDLQNVSQRVEQRIVRAPRAGQIVRLIKVGSGATVKANDVLAILAPTTTDQAVELFVTDNDAPLVAVGRHVRLQFAGFPALQIAGVPSLAVGTFGGTVAVIDQIDDGKNRYRIIIKPDADTINSGQDRAWVSTKTLRPGTEATGWIMLDTVPLGFELWRQFNAFPPTIAREPLDKSDKRSDEKPLDEEIDLKDVLKK